MYVINEHNQYSTYKELMLAATFDSGVIRSDSTTGALPCRTHEG